MADPFRLILKLAPDDDSPPTATPGGEIIGAPMQGLLGPDDQCPSYGACPPNCSALNCWHSGGSSIWYRGPGCAPIGSSGMRRLFRAPSGGE